MVAVPKVIPRYYTLEEYFEIDARSGERLEYVDGEIVAMAGESPEHNEIAGNLLFEIKGQFRGRPCKVYIENVRVQVSRTKYRYPDIAALCGEAQFRNTRPKTLLNPRVIFEVLSPSTDDTDTGEKFDEYAQIATLTDYILVAQNTMRVRHYRRREGDKWEIDTFTQAEEVLPLQSLALSLPLAAIYAEIAFPQPLVLENVDEPEGKE